MQPLTLVEPAPMYVEEFCAALRTGWSPMSTRDISAEVLAEIEADSDGYLARLKSPTGLFKHPSGRMVPRLPMMTRWLWDGAFCGTTNLRWQNGTDALPSYVSGHIGYTVVPWKRGRGYATSAFQQMLHEAHRIGLRRVEVTTDIDNIASQRVIVKGGGVFVETRPPDEFHDKARKLFVVDLDR